MLHPTPVSQPTSSADRARTADLAPIAGGEAWIVPFEPGGPVWITATAPAIRVVDRRVAAARPLATAGH